MSALYFIAAGMWSVTCIANLFVGEYFIAFLSGFLFMKDIQLAFLTE